MHPDPTGTVCAARALAGLVLLALATASCAARRPAQPVVVPQPVPVAGESGPPAEEQAPHEDALRLYHGIDAHVADYEEGIDLLVAGDEVPGEEQIAAATNGLLADAEACARIPGCETGRFVRALNRLLTDQSIALKTQAARLRELEASAEEDVEREPGTSPFDAAMPELVRTQALLRGTDLREIINVNGPVRAALDDWLTWMRPMLMEAYENYQFLRARMAPIYEEAGLPEALLFAMVATETGGKVHSYSRAGAAGPLQFMRRTGQRYGLGVEDGFDMRLDPAAATRANVAYLNEQFEALNDSLEMTLAAYNGGEGRARNLHRKYRDTSVWDSRVYYSLPAETREYVPRVLAAAWLFLHPEEYNLEFPTYRTETTLLELKRPASIDELTICLGQFENRTGWFRTLRNLNPRLSPGDRLEAGLTIEIPAILVPAYEERCVEGPWVERARELHDANYPEEPEMIPYVVRSGDTLARIASRHSCVTIAELAGINGIRGPRYVIRVGQTLKVPTCG
jgi:membrane-bound lytic murein transglycosylase D